MSYKSVAFTKTMLDTLRLKINRFMATQEGFSPLSAQQYAAYNRYRPLGG